MYKIATWNVNSIKVRLPHIFQWLESAKADILAIQETKSTDEKFPLAEIEEAGYQVVFSGQKTYNGVAIISKHPAEDIITDLPGLDDPQRRVLAATIDGVRVLNLYVPNGQSVDSDKYQYKLNWLRHLDAYVQQQLTEHDKIVILGDFNIAPEDRDVHDPKRWEGDILVSDKERAAFQQLLDHGLQDTFRLFEQQDRLFSWWDYRMLGFRRNHGLRIDHILANETMAQACQSCVINKEPRKWERPSDHTVVMAEFNIP